MNSTCLLSESFFYRLRILYAKWIIFFLILLMSIVYGLELFHIAQVSHQYCPEHGLLVHEDELMDSSSIDSGLPSTTYHGKKSELFNQQIKILPDYHKHAHCLLLDLRSTRSLYVIIFKVFPFVLIYCVYALRLVFDNIHIPSSSLTYRLAPKHSPPSFLI